jgi:hypothetical protein
MNRLTAYLSGTENSLPDYPLALASFGMSKRNAAASYYTATVPYTDETLQAFTDRPDGKVYIQKDGTAWESFNVGHPIRFDIGPRSATISLSGTRQETNASPVTITISPAWVAKDGIDSDGRLTLDLIPTLVDPKPGDTVTWQAVDYLVDRVQFNAGATSQTLKLTAQEVAP